ncbi:hypothetical protein CC85DRAFT_331127 [Cutaneotrichosporon oleaginosum]|uniref:RRM domain-containing protein n=1 Tax=Cutaneotrichosporon oleaginosum TaxID=879819 RepID=A0A0J0XD86_9TREE|nr:uncharacterized protein CC85DRAFT_331127 [Cutaneotrichosporon oleaginosum]KLT39012.1 hypothetical protein CC85DRAFT_331127 [Cutaneotrichosporon oleaginosum]TXT08318.1 hypothetical protein COLE_05242 [Cutaneotrichosporon oleaginosum]
MSRAKPKPYDRDRDRDRDRGRNLDAPWKHDLHSSHSLAARLDRGSSSGSASPSLLNRLGGGSGSGRGKELLPSSTKGGMYGFDSKPNAGVELLPSTPSSKTAQPSRARRGQAGDEAGRTLAAKSIAAITGRVRDRDTLSIVGAARSTWVKVERLARGTTAEDVKSAFAHHPIGGARVSSRPSDRTVTVELEMPDREAALAVVKEYDGVPADGETLRVALVGARDLGARLRRDVEPEKPKQPERTGKMYADQIADAPVITVPQDRREARVDRGGGSLASRMGRR